MSNTFRPLGFKMLPDIIKNLLIINGILFLATVVAKNSFGFDLADILGLYMPGGDNFRGWQLITHMFMHANMMHIFFNMFALWMFGNVIENIWGGKRFLIYYLSTGLGAVILHLGVNYMEILQLKNELLSHGVSVQIIDAIVQSGNITEANSILNSHNISNLDVDTLSKLFFKYNIPTIGASGAVYGVLLAFGMMFPNTYIYIYFLFPIKAKWLVIIYGAFELINGILNDPTSNVAHFAHLGGMIFGYILIRYWKHKKVF